MNTQKNTYIIVLLMISPILFIGLALLLIFIPLPEPFPIAGSNARNLVTAIITGFLGLAWVVALSIYLIKVIFMAGRVFDTAFTSRGLSVSNYLGLGRQFQGRSDGRQVEAQYSPGRMLQNGLLNIRFEININQRMAIGVTKPLLECNDCGKVDISPYPLGSIQVYAEDPDWAKNLLSDPSNVEMIKKLMDDTERLGRRELYLLKKQAWLHARPTPRFSSAQLQIWLGILFDLFRSIEKMN